MFDRAGTVALPEDLTDIDALISAYYDIEPDPSNPDQRVSFGTSGHRGSAFDGKFNEAHIVAITQAIVDYRAEQGFNGPLFIGRDTHALTWDSGVLHPSPFSVSYAHFPVRCDTLALCVTSAHDRAGRQPSS